MSLPETTTPENLADADTQKPRESTAKGVRSETFKTLGAKPGPIGVHELLHPELRMLVHQFNTVLQKPANQLTKNDGWDQVAGIMTYLAWNLEPSRNDAMTLSELYRKTMVFFGNEAYLQASGMSDPAYLDAFLGSLQSMEEKARPVLHPAPKPELSAAALQRMTLG